LVTSIRHSNQSPKLAPDEAYPHVSPSRRCVVVHSGSRDGYQLALGLSETGLLESLVTDLYWPVDRRWIKRIAALLPASLKRMLAQRNHRSLPSSQVKTCTLYGLATLLLDKLPHVPFVLRRSVARRTDAVLGRTAGKLATRRGAGLVAYSYYAHDAFANWSGAGILFQLHPHPLSMRRILRDELAAHPDCAESLQQEWELSLPEADFQRLVDEPSLPDHILCASSFTRTTLVENGIAADRITVVPYGVDCERFVPAPARDKSCSGKLKLLFVGRINQRKGVKYLLEALRLLDTRNIELTICGRVVDSLELFKPFADCVNIRPSVSNEELVAAYQSADLFVFPSVAEGFGQVLLESLACGLPILSTTHTAAPDLIDDGVEGFVVEPRNPELLAERIHWAHTHRAELDGMRAAARQRAESFTWARFRSRAVAAIIATHRSSQRQALDQEVAYNHV
jgi:glycosyltransferase involved in cell wall biosynthesis